MRSRRVLVQQETHMRPNEMVYIVDDDARAGEALSPLLRGGQALRKLLSAGAALPVIFITGPKNQSKEPMQILSGLIRGGSTAEGNQT